MVSNSFFNDPQMLAPPRTLKIDFDDGSFVLRSPEPLQPYARCLGEWLERWAVETPDAIAFAERGPDGEWCRLSYAVLRARVGAVAQSLLDLKLAEGAPIVVLSDNSLDHLVLLLASMHVGRPVCTVSSAYCRLTRDYARIHGILDALAPTLVYASDASSYGPALSSWEGICSSNALRVFSQGSSEVPGAHSYAKLASTTEGPSVMAAYEAITPDQHAKYLLTSGSTGTPKIVINTHRMLCANQQMMAQVWRFLGREKPVLLDWLPWSHTFGGNYVINLTLFTGGTLYIDEGRPVLGLIDKTVRNLREIRPTLYFNVPRGYEMLLPALESDASFAADFLGHLRMAFYAGAALSPSIWKRLMAVAAPVRREPLWLTTGLGSTETAPAMMMAHWQLDEPGVIGLPIPGAEVKFVPNAGKLELRVRGPSVFPGYRNAPAQTAQAFDEEGYYRLGDAGRLVDSLHPQRGVIFDGRVTEDFKLNTGTWVSVGTLRVKLVSALAPFAQDVVITGHSRDELGMMVFPSDAAKNADTRQLAAKLREVMAALQAAGLASSQCPGRALWLAEPPNADAGEINDKGYVNQRTVLTRRAAEVEALYTNPPPAHVVVHDLKP